MKMKFSAFFPHSLAWSGICDLSREGVSSIPDDHSSLRPVISGIGGNWMTTREQSGGPCCRFVYRSLATWGKHTTPKIRQPVWKFMSLNGC